jgi:hypothetical protein
LFKEFLDHPSQRRRKEWVDPEGIVAVCLDPEGILDLRKDAEVREDAELESIKSSPV